jgi:hypothetical protein
MHEVEVARRLSFAPRRGPGAARAAANGGGFGRPSDPTGNLCLGVGGGWPHGRARSFHVFPRPSSPERPSSHAIVSRLGVMLHARRFHSVPLGWGPSQGRRRGGRWRRAHRLRCTGRGAENGGEQGHCEYECGAGARHGDACRGSCHICCR